MNRIEQAQEKFALLDKITLGAFVLQSDYSVLFWNCSLEEWTQIPRSRILGNSILEYFSHLDQPRYINRLQQIFQGGPPTIFSSQLHQYIIPVPLPQEKYRIQHTTVTAVQADGDEFYALFSIQDVTDLTFRVQEYKHLRDKALAEAEARQRSQEAAEAANRIKDEFLAIVSHELRSPLNPILGWAKLLKKRNLNEITTLRAVETIERNAELQAQLIDDLLDISRILRGKLGLNLETVNLAATIEAALDTVRLAAEAKSIQIHLNLDSKVAQVKGDSSRLQQVVWNLLSNAIKFTPTGGEIEVKLQQINSQVEIQVSDTGKGISPDFLPHVFEYFRQADSTITRRSGGLGLGLAIVRQLVELHGGRVWAESLGEEKGATFTVSLPALQKTLKLSSRDSDLAQDSYSLSVPYAPLEGIKVLIVDDDIDTREFLAFLLEQHGAFVTSAASANEALAAIAQTKPDLLLSDLGMPEVDGYALIRTIRRLPKHQGGQIPAIALTAYAAETTQQQVFAAGFQLHIAKPADPSKLIAAIAALVKR
ncbi:PAS domain-containing hybrid sensor histidine kinase/response regulator [Tolypothrix sp. PCC 7910]|uniref:hybrid sensor histidine kinase/response regulator n=1 Tax=Tolypothrix sp. PCC 7910 TaxID=2099387 RepID=UPI00142774A6|nr:ATP-binding protein [Tolypothrix sp. PCC 7910]QIR39935.1 PAS domain-containing hybrid sensor histidine kinase/response regulator [Tolypothrix sp. PCC 7910]